MEKRRLEVTSFLVLCTGILILAFFVFQPFFSILALAAVLTLLFKPLYKKMLLTYKGGENFFAFLIVLTALIFLILPVLFLGLKILGQMQNLFTLVQNGQGESVQALRHTVESFVQHLFPAFTFDISYYASRILVFVSNNFGTLLSQTASLFFQIFFLLFAFFFFLRDGEKISSSAVRLSPFENMQTKKILMSLHDAVTSVIRGTLFVGLIRWVLFIAGFYIFQIPDAMVWGSIAGVIGIIPGLGTPFVVIPTVMYLVFTGSMFSAIGIGLFGIVIMIFIDNMLSAYFFGKGLDASPVFILFSILGGVLFFGPLGFIFGPIVLSLCISMVEMYKILILEK